MSEFGVSELMPPKKRPSKVGRPAIPDPLRSLVSLKGSVKLEAWIDKLVEHARQGTRSLLIRNALAEYAENHGFKEPQPKR